MAADVAIDYAPLGRDPYFRYSIGMKSETETMALRIDPTVP
jgi:hypothetical protein